jgi:hypothetical protein
MTERLDGSLSLLSQRTLEALATENILARIERLIDEAVRAKRFRSRTAFLEQAGKSSGYLGEFRSRIAEDPNATITADTARAFAELLAVPVQSIIHPEQDDVPPLVDKFPGRAWAIVAARTLQLPEAAIQLVLKEEPGRDPGRMYWFRRIEAEAERVRPAP